MFCSYYNKERIFPGAIQLAIVSDEEMDLLNDRLSSINIPNEVYHQWNMKKVSDEYPYANVDVKEDDMDYSQPEDIYDDDYEEEDYNADKDDKTEYRWVGDKDRFQAFLYWLSGNECSDEDKEEITGSFNLLCGCFTAEDLLTVVRTSGLYSVQEIDNSVLKIISQARKVITMSINECVDEFKYFGMLNNDNVTID